MNTSFIGQLTSYHEAAENEVIHRDREANAARVKRLTSERWVELLSEIMKAGTKYKAQDLAEVIGLRPNTVRAALVQIMLPKGLVKRKRVSKEGKHTYYLYYRPRLIGRASVGTERKRDV